jgi:hypothetical protein
VLEHHLKVSGEMCGVLAFMEKGMRPNWSEAGAPERLQKLLPAYERLLNAKEGEALGIIVAEEIKVRGGVGIRKDQVRFLNPPFLSRSPRGSGTRWWTVGVLTPNNSRFTNAFTKCWDRRMIGSHRTTSPTRSPKCWWTRSTGRS